MFFDQWFTECRFSGLEENTRWNWRNSRGSGGRPSASRHYDLLIHVPMSWVCEEDWHREHRCIGRPGYVSVLRRRRDCGLAVVHQQIAAAGLPNEHAEVAYLRGCLRRLVSDSVSLDPALALVFRIVCQLAWRASVKTLLRKRGERIVVHNMKIQTTSMPRRVWLASLHIPPTNHSWA